MPDDRRDRARAPGVGSGHGPRAMVLALLALCAGARADEGGEQPARTVGHLALQQCPPVPERWCATVDRALDPGGAVPGRIPVYVEFYAHRAPGPAAGTLVAIEGGPGYPSTRSRDTYLALFDPLRDQRDVVLVDARGTGASGAIDCRPLQQAEAITTVDVGACGRWLGPRAPLYSTANAADDLAYVLEQLQAGPVDLYGDSYGSFAAQVFAWRHPDQLRSLTLDGTYPLAAPEEAWQPSYAPAMRDKFEIACARSSACSRRPGGTLARLAPVLDNLRRRPVTVRVADADGRPTTVHADASALARVMFGSAPAVASVRELDAAARAYAGGDHQPLLRLMAESLRATDSREAGGDPAAFSLGQSVAVMCQDAQQIYDMRLPPAARRAQRDAAIARKAREAPDLYAPFTMAEYRSLPLDYAYLDECIDWPAPPPEHPPQVLHDPAAAPPQIPVLVLAGELDNMTTPTNGAQAAAVYPRARAITLRNSLHVNAKPGRSTDCAMALARRFMATLDAGDSACADAIPPLQLVPAFARRLRDLDPADALEGNEAGAVQRRAAAAAVLALGDVLGRLETNTSGHGPGLRGGTFEVLADAQPMGTAGAGEAAVHVALRALKFTEDLAIDGEMQWSGPAGSNLADLELHGLDGGVTGKLHVTWSSAGEQPTLARIEGRIGGHRIVAGAPAPQ